MKRIAFEGPSLAGKSTVAKHLASRLQAHGASTALLPDYFEVTSAMKVEFSLQPKTPEEQLLLVTMHIGIEMLRHASIPADTNIAILDRSLWTTLAHTQGLIRTGALASLPAYKDSRLLEAMKPWLPDLVLYINTPLATRYQRRNTRDSLPDLHVDQAFSQGVSDFFLDLSRADTSNVRILDGSLDESSILEQAWSSLKDASLC